MHPSQQPHVSAAAPLHDADKPHGKGQTSRHVQKPQSNWACLLRGSGRFSGTPKGKPVQTPLQAATLILQESEGTSNPKKALEPYHTLTKLQPVEQCAAWMQTILEPSAEQGAE